MHTHTQTASNSTLHTQQNSEHQIISRQMYLVITVTTVTTDVNTDEHVHPCNLKHKQ